MNINVILFILLDQFFFSPDFILKVTTRIDILTVQAFKLMVFYLFNYLTP